MSLLARFAGIGFLLLSCCSPDRSPTAATSDNAPAPPPADTTVTLPPAPPDTAVSFGVFEPKTGTCTLTARRAAPIYQRPDDTTPKFGQLAAGEEVHPAARTADGWLGFDPAVAQAANVGIFRLRWVRLADAFAPTDSCPDLPVVQAPPYACFVMAGRPVRVLAAAQAQAPVLATIPANGYARVVQKQLGEGRKWAEVELPGRTAHGYIIEADVNFNGPCQ